MESEPSTFILPVLSHPNSTITPVTPETVRFQSIAEILLQGIRRCVVADRDLDGDSDEYSNTEKPVSDNFGDSLPEPLDFVFDKPLSVSNVSETLGFGDERDIQNGGKS